MYPYLLFLQTPEMEHLGNNAAAPPPPKVITPQKLNKKLVKDSVTYQFLKNPGIDKDRNDSFAFLDIFAIMAFLALYKSVKITDSQHLKTFPHTSLFKIQIIVNTKL